MNNKYILANAEKAKGATHVLGGNCYCNEYVREDHESDGYGYLTYVNNETTTEGHRSLADIKRIVELELSARRLLDASTLESQENAMAELEELLAEPKP
jgi:hypothetical protein